MRLIPASKPATYSEQQLIQTLESRRLMSFTTGLEFSQASPPPPHGGDAGEHSFGPLQHDVGTDGFNPGGQIPQPANFSESASADLNWLQAQFAHAIAQGTSIAVTPAPALVSSTTTLSTLYSSLDHSAVNQIDSAAATTTSVAAAISTSMSSPTLSETAQPSAAISQNLGDGQGAISHETKIAIPDLTSDKALAKALSVFVTPLMTPATNGSATPSWASLHRLEADLTAIKDMATAVVAEMGREAAIAFSHLESMIEPEAGVNPFSSMQNWKSAAIITAAAIAAVAFAQSEAGEKKKDGSVFSTRLIEQVQV